jgi:hypothetical protein
MACSLEKRWQSHRTPKVLGGAVVDEMRWFAARSRSALIGTTTTLEAKIKKLHLRLVANYQICRMVAAGWCA